jgi:regulator of nonsense transcripts 2
VKLRTPLELYLHKLIYFDLKKSSVNDVLRQIRKFPWEDDHIERLMIKAFTQIWKSKYSNIHLMAAIASGLLKFHSKFIVNVIDGIVEEIRFGLETNHFNWNQRRISTVKYLAELYNYRVVEHNLIFDTLYLILTFGHEKGLPEREKICVLDSPTDLFRIRIVCVILQTCGKYFDSPSANMSLDWFLVFLQYYVFTKQKLSMDIDFMLQDMYEEIRPQMKLLASYEDCLIELERISAERRVIVDPEPERKPVDEEDDDVSLSGSYQSSESVSDMDDIGDEAEEDVIDEPVEETEPVVDEEFERLYSQMMNESLESRKFDRKAGTFDAAVPIIKKSDEKVENKVSFVVLAKKGAKTKEIQVPLQSDLALKTIHHQEEQRKEQLRLKQLVLDYEESNKDSNLTSDTKNEKIALNSTKGNIYRRR